MQPLTESLHLRPVTSRDIPVVQALVASVLQEYGLQPDHSSTDADLKGLPGSYTQQGGCFFVIEDRNVNKIVGTAGLYVLRQGVAEIRKMYLLPQARGKGLGRYMLQYLMQQARVGDIRQLELETASVLKEAICLYESAGFKPKAASPAASRCDQVFELML